MSRLIASRFELGRCLPHPESKLATFEARDTQTGEPVLIAALRPEFAADPVVLETHKYGLDRIAMLDHPGIQRILARVHDPELGEVYVVPWLPDGTTSLRSLLRNDAVFTEQEAVELVRQLLDALAYAHAHGVVFGNVKPTNMLITPRRDRVVVSGLPKPPIPKERRTTV
jgi:serine/threonine-protein kinase